MIIETSHHDMSVRVKARLDVDARRGQEARIEGAMRLRGVRGDVHFYTGRRDGIAEIWAHGFQ